jgi:gamma-glutamylaminecyclotransferase
MGHLLFVYGTLKRGFGNNRVLGDSKFLFTGTTKEPYGFFDLGAFPCITKDGDVHVQGEVFELDDATLERADRLEGHPHFYKREVIIVNIHDLSEEKCWAYFMVRPSYLSGKPITKWPCETT